MHINLGTIATFTFIVALSGCGHGPADNGRDTCSSPKDCPTTCCYYTSPVYADGTLSCEDAVAGCSYQGVDTQASVVCENDGDCAGVSWRQIGGGIEPASTCCSVERQPGESVHICRPSCA